MRAFIGAYAFDGCTSLSKANIENVEEFMTDGFFEYTYREGYLSSGKTMTTEYDITKSGNAAKALKGTVELLNYRIVSYDTTNQYSYHYWYRSTWTRE